MTLEYDAQKGGFIRRSTNEYLYDYFQNRGFFFSREILTDLLQLPKNSSTISDRCLP